MKKAGVSYLFTLFLLVLTQGCGNKKSAKKHEGPITSDKVTHAKGFTIEDRGDFTVVTVTDPWPNADKPYTYALIPREKLAAITLPKDAYDAVIPTPVNSLVATSTTHIPALESLDGLSKLSGFPNTKYISSMPARKMISSGKIRDLGKDQSLNTEIVLELQPDAVIGFAINNDNTSYDIIQKAGIPVLFNGDWTEQTPLGRAEWIKFFGALLGKQEEANEIFEEIKISYEEVAILAQQATTKPKVLSGSLFKDVWYLPAGESWAAQFLQEANTNYLWSQTKGVGSLSLSLETVINQGQEADFWISPGSFTSYGALELANPHYAQFKAFQQKQVYGFAATAGPTGGLLYYELAPQRPDLVLKDLVHIFHPELQPDHQPFFFKPLE